jgi:hypothetical protein
VTARAARVRVTPDALVDAVAERVAEMLRPELESLRAMLAGGKPTSDGGVPSWSEEARRESMDHTSIAKGRGESSSSTETGSDIVSRLRARAQSKRPATRPTKSASGSRGRP